MSHKIKFWLTTCGRSARVCLWQQFHASLELRNENRYSDKSSEAETMTVTIAAKREFEELCYGNKFRRVLSRMDKHGKRRRSKAMAASFLTTVESGAEVEPPLAGRWKRGEHQLISGNQRTNHSHHITASRRRRIIALSKILRLLWAHLPWKQGISH